MPRQILAVVFNRYREVLHTEKRKTFFASRARTWSLKLRARQGISRKGFFEQKIRVLGSCRAEKAACCKA
ncbi:MAG: hypothetical protein N3B10_09675 [Armatimonadetes bacterium]|nr:hypothetical protein [Armatimonadota bacterium]MCX7968737.1 hypothetical protein [Armatimonadota bacterium]MDW8143840.1 hypothetical protein [Armatimonadota bacterium]